MTSLNFRKINIRPYKPGKSILKKKTKVIKLSANESALGISPMAKKSISNKKMILDKYPDFDPSWSPDVQKSWIESMTKLYDNLK